MKKILALVALLAAFGAEEHRGV
jgi:hypothetical protein